MTDEGLADMKLKRDPNERREHGLLSARLQLHHRLIAGCDHGRTCWLSNSMFWMGSRSHPGQSLKLGKTDLKSYSASFVCSGVESSIGPSSSRALSTGDRRHQAKKRTRNMLNQ